MAWPPDLEKNFKVLYLNNYTFSMPGFYIIFAYLFEALPSYKIFFEICFSDLYLVQDV